MIKTIRPQGHYKLTGLKNKLIMYIFLNKKKDFSMNKRWSELACFGIC